ncbi:hypothetical protein C8R42DRAFT_715087 [Lentinula raphanica]|nr:hypothetical protein C8R42DRAFT_715087 [Lentinula raphanica]
MENASQCIIGPESVEHPYFKAFLKGLLLPCGTLGVNLSEIARRFTGGTSEFVNSLLETRIKGDYTMLRIDYINHINNSVQRELKDALSLVFPAMSDEGFPAIFRSRFADVVPLDDVSKKEFRMRMFCWATTGVPHILVDGSYTESPVHGYGTSDEARRQYLDKGTCGFRTCTRMMFIPVSYLLKLLKAPSSDPQAVMDAISSWLFLQILDGVGNYNIL